MLLGLAAVLFLLWIFGPSPAPFAPYLPYVIVLLILVNILNLNR